jgi:hypothetical protein
MSLNESAIDNDGPRSFGSPRRHLQVKTHKTMNALTVQNDPPMRTANPFDVNTFCGRAWFSSS